MEVESVSMGAIVIMELSCVGSVVRWSILLQHSFVASPVEPPEPVATTYGRCSDMVILSLLGEFGGLLIPPNCGTKVVDLMDIHCYMILVMFRLIVWRL